MTPKNPSSRWCNNHRRNILVSAEKPIQNTQLFLFYDNIGTAWDFWWIFFILVPRSSCRLPRFVFENFLDSMKLSRGQKGLGSLLFKSFTRLDEVLRQINTWLAFVHQIQWRVTHTLVEECRLPRTRLVSICLTRTETALICFHFRYIVCRGEFTSVCNALLYWIKGPVL